MMHRTRNAIAAASAAILFAALPAVAVTNGYSDAPPGVTSQMASGGSSASFEAQVVAALVNFKTVTKIYRQCVRGAAVSDDVVDCDGNAATKDAVQSFVLIEGTMWDVADASNPGTLAGGSPVGIATPGTNLYVMRIGSHGSSRGINCAKTTSPIQIGFLAPEGKDGTFGTADDAGCPVGGIPFDGTNGGTATCGYGFTGAGNGSGATRQSAQVTNCGGASASSLLGDIRIPASTSFAGSQQFCIIDDDTSGDGALAGANDGTPVGAANLLEASTLRVNCSLGFADLPPTDFSDSALNTSLFADQNLSGAQIFKLAATKNIVAASDTTKKPRWNKPQIEALFKTSGANSAFLWREVGAKQIAGAGAAPADNGGVVKICGRTAGSGTKEVFRLSWLTNTGGSSNEGAANQSTVRTIGGVGSLVTKQVSLTATTDTVVQCLEAAYDANQAAIGYIDGSKFPNTSPVKWYGVPVEGVDPDTNDLKQLVRCGQYRWWGPLTNGRRTAVDGTPISALESSFRGALQNTVVWNNVAPINVNFQSYEPLSTVYFGKTTTDGAYSENPIVPEQGGGASVFCPSFPADPAAPPL